MKECLDFHGVSFWKSYLDLSAQKQLVEQARLIAAQAPFFQSRMANGRPLSVQMTSAGRVGWMSDGAGYRYARAHPGGGEWPELPKMLLALWDEVTGASVPPDSCLLNYYGEGARMGLHQDRDERDLSQPVVSVSLGDDALFRIGGTERGGPTSSLWLQSGDVLVLQGASRLAYHGIDRIRFGSSRLLSRGGRLNLTLRAAF